MNAARDESATSFSGWGKTDSSLPTYTFRLGPAPWASMRQTSPVFASPLTRHSVLEDERPIALPLGAYTFNVQAAPLGIQTSWLPVESAGVSCGGPPGAAASGQLQPGCGGSTNARPIANAPQPTTAANIASRSPATTSPVFIRTV